MNRFYSNGKLLVTGEYLVLDGALSLAVPTQFGQTLKAEPIDEKKIIWESIDDKGNVWFKDEFNIRDKIFLFTRNLILLYLNFIFSFSLSFLTLPNCFERLLHSLILSYDLSRSQ